MGLMRCVTGWAKLFYSGTLSQTNLSLWTNQLYTGKFLLGKYVEFKKCCIFVRR